MSEALRPFRQEWIDYMATDSPDGYWDAEPRAEAEDRWDRAIAAHDRQVKAEAWDEGAAAGWDRDGFVPYSLRRKNPYRIESEARP